MAWPTYIFADDDEHKGLQYRSVIIPTYKTRKSTVVHGSQLWPRTTDETSTDIHQKFRGGEGGEKGRRGEEDGTGIRKHSPG